MFPPIANSFVVVLGLTIELLYCSAANLFTSAVLKLGLFFAKSLLDCSCSFPVVCVKV